MSRQYRVYCITEGINVFVMANATPTMCPNNAAHTINTDSINISDDNKFGCQLYGDGADGDVTITTNTTLARDMYYRNLTINAGALLGVNGWRIFVADTLNIISGWIHCDGRPGDTTGVSNTARVLGYGSGGGVGGVAGPTAGSAGSTLPAGTMMGGVGGTGGIGRNSIGGGTGGTAQTPPASSGGIGWFRIADIALTGRNPTGVVLNGGTGGGGGGGGSGSGTSANGGTGGGGAGVVVVAARTITATTGGIRAIGGIGGTANGQGGGGGGGGGGCVVVISVNDLSALTINVSGGAAGPSSTGVMGNPGSAGNSFKIITG